MSNPDRTSRPVARASCAGAADLDDERPAASTPEGILEAIVSSRRTVSASTAARAAEARAVSGEPATAVAR